MNQKKPPLTKSPEHDWQVLGEFKLMIGDMSEHTINRWLSAILSLLEFQTDFVNKVLQSAHNAVLHASQMEGAVSSEHIHLIILIPEELKLNNRNWGFFRIEKIGNDEAMLDHTIELYLYQEG